MSKLSLVSNIPISKYKFMEMCYSVTYTKQERDNKLVINSLDARDARIQAETVVKFRPEKKKNETNVSEEQKEQLFFREVISTLKRKRERVNTYSWTASSSPF